MRQINGVVYILKFHEALGNPDKPKGRAQFYVGWCELGGLKRRLRQHRKGQGAAITRAFALRGIGFELVVSFAGTRSDERRVKRYGNTRLFVQRKVWERQKHQAIPF